MKISAYIPCYNSRSTVALAVASLREQTHPVDEVFVVDDGSTDGSGRVGAAPVVRMKTNSGRGAARARGMENARHELVLCCDAGETLATDFLEKALAWFADEHVGAVFGRLTQPPPRNTVERWRGRHLFHENAPPSAAVHRASLITSGCLLRASAVRAVGGFDPKMRADEDADLGARLLASGWDVVYDPALIIVSIESNSLSQLLERYWRWNAAPNGHMSIPDYLRQIVFSIKVMAREDLGAHDPLAALISLLSPHYQFWAPRFFGGGKHS